MTRELTEAFCQHVARAHELLSAAGIPMPLHETLDVFRLSSVLFTLGRDRKVVAHAEVTRNALSPHRARVSYAVESAYQRAGIGTQLLGRALSWCDANSVEAIDAWTWADNDASRHMLARAGFTELCTVHDAYRARGGKRLDQVLLVRTRPAQVAAQGGAWHLQQH